MLNNNEVTSGIWGMSGRLNIVPFIPLHWWIVVKRNGQYVRYEASPFHDECEKVSHIIRTPQDSLYAARSIFTWPFPLYWTQSKIMFSATSTTHANIEELVSHFEHVVRSYPYYTHYNIVTKNCYTFFSFIQAYIAQTNKPHNLN